VSEREQLARDMRRQMFMLTSGTSAFRRRSLRIVRRLRSAFGRLRRGLARKFA